MTALPNRPSFWTGPRLLALGVAASVLTLFIVANVHLIAVSFASRPDCALQSPTEGVMTYRAALPSC